MRQKPLGDFEQGSDKKRLKLQRGTLAAGWGVVHMGTWGTHVDREVARAALQG